MPATLAQLLRIQSAAAESVVAYLKSLEAALGHNLLLHRLGRRSMETLRMPLQCEPFRREMDQARARQREQLWEGADARRETESQEEGNLERRAYAHRESDAAADGRLRISPAPLDDVARKLEMGLIIGDPGSGKTEWLKHQAVLEAHSQAAALREGRLLPQQAPPPLFVRLPELARQVAGNETTRSAWEFACQECGREAGPSDLTVYETALATILKTAQLATPELRGFVLRLLWRLYTGSQVLPCGGVRPLLLCLDAWDEVPDALRDDLVALLHVFAENAPARIFATSRAVGYQPGLLPIAASVDEEQGDHDLRRELRVLEFDAEGTKQFYRRFYGEDSATPEKPLADLRTRPQIQGLAANPLMATLLGSVFGPRISGLQPLSLPARRIEVYGEVLRELLGESSVRKQRHQNDDIIRAKLELLSALAFRFFPDEIIPKTEAETFVDSWLCHESRGTLRKRLATEVRTRNRTHLLDVLAQDDSVLVTCECREDTGLMFLHLTMQEYLAARFLGRAVNQVDALQRGHGFARATLPYGSVQRFVRVQLLVDHKAESPRWRHVMILLAGQLKDAEPMLALLAAGTPIQTEGGVERRHDLVHYRLCTAAACLAETTPETRDGNPECAADRITRQIMDIWQQHDHRGATWPESSFQLAAFTDSQVWRWLATANARVAAEEHLIENFVDRLSDGDNSMVRAAAEVLGKMGAVAVTPDVLAPLLLRLSADKDGLFWLQTIETLEWLGDTAATPEVLVALLILLSDETWRQRRGAELYTCEEWLVRRRAIKALGSMGAAAAQPKVLAALVAQLSHGIYLVPHAAAETLGHMGQVAARPEVLAALQELCSHYHDDVRGAAAWALRRLTAETDASDSMGSLWARIMEKRGPPAADTLVSDLSSSHPSTRRKAIKDLRKYMDEPVLNLLSQAFTHTADKQRLTGFFDLFRSVTNVVRFYSPGPSQILQWRWVKDLETLPDAS